jgi:hypothetical protein
MLVRIMLIGSLLAANSIGALNSTLLETCKSTFYACAQNLALVNVTDYFETNCTEPFNDCMSELLSVNAPWPQECYQATAAWENCYISLGCFAGILVFNNILAPALFKGAAWGITKCMKVDPERHSILRRIGKVFGVFFDENRNGEVTATEIISPQSFVTFVGLSIPVYYVFIATDMQAKCDFARAVVKCAIPGFDDDDFCHAD